MAFKVKSTFVTAFSAFTCSRYNITSDALTVVTELAITDASSGIHNADALLTTDCNQHESTYTYPYEMSLHNLTNLQTCSFISNIYQ